MRVFHKHRCIARFVFYVNMFYSLYEPCPIAARAPPAPGAVWPPRRRVATAWRRTMKRYGHEKQLRPHLFMVPPGARRRLAVATARRPSQPRRPSRAVAWAARGCIPSGAGYSGISPEGRGQVTPEGRVTGGIPPVAASGPFRGIVPCCANDLPCVFHVIVYFMHFMLCAVPVIICFLRLGQRVGPMPGNRPEAVTRTGHIIGCVSGVGTVWRERR